MTVCVLKINAESEYVNLNAEYDDVGLRMGYLQFIFDYLSELQNHTVHQEGEHGIHYLLNVSMLTL